VVVNGKAAIYTKPNYFFILISLYLDEEIIRMLYNSANKYLDNIYAQTGHPEKGQIIKIWTKV
jgi:hypothetical protein